MSEQHLGMRLNIELGTELMLDVHGMEGKMKSRLIGHEPSEFLIVRTPIGYVGVRRNLFEGNKVTVRYIHHGNVYGFESFILTLVNKPKSLLFLDYPTKVAQVSLRKNERYDCYIPCVANFDNKEEKATIMDLSLTGCRCLLPNISHRSKRKPPEIDKEIMLRFESPAHGESIEIKAHVMNVTDYHSAARVGMVFDNRTDANHDGIKKLINFLAIQ